MQIGSVVVEKMEDEAEMKIWSGFVRVALCSVSTGWSGSNPVGSVPLITESKPCCSVNSGHC